MRYTSAESPRVPAPGLSAQGKSAPKARTKVVVDGNAVNILQPAARDGSRGLYMLIGIYIQIELSRK